MNNQERQALIERLEKIMSWQEIYGAGSNVVIPAGEAAEIAKIALAALTAEPEVSNKTRDWGTFRDEAQRLNADSEHVFRRTDVLRFDTDPVMYQERTRPTWDKTAPWSRWSECSQDGYNNRLKYVDEPDYSGWIYQVRRLYAGPPAPAGWIKCSERMPDRKIPVLVMHEDGDMWAAIWSGQYWDDGCTIPDPHSITYWQPMPAAPHSND